MEYLKGRKVKNMNKYESIIIVNPCLKDVEIEKLREKIQNLIKENGKFESIEDLGIKRLAYEIRKNNEGHYIIFNFESNSDFIVELERVYRINDDILKFIVVRKD